MERTAAILVVDDHSLVLEGICRVLSKIPEVHVEDAVTSGEDACRLVDSKIYDLYILDVSMPEISGFDLILKIRQRSANARIIINTMHEEIWMVNRLIQSKVNAIVLKASASSELMSAVLSVLEGESYTCPRFAAIKNKLERTDFFRFPSDKPTKRELDVLSAVSRGMNTHEIALALGISDNTVETFRRKLIAKFGAKNTADLVVKAIGKGWISLEKE